MAGCLTINEKSTVSTALASLSRNNLTVFGRISAELRIQKDTMRPRSNIPGAESSLFLQTPGSG
jgi:hypothetical protein